MSVTQYIGARYVPLFADPLAWDITKTYEALTIVYHQGNSYTSRQAVPAGIDITNDAYWALTGNYNAQIEQYRAEVQTYDDRITANTSSNTSQDAQLAGTASSGLKTLIDDNASDITALSDTVSGLSGRVSNVEDDLSQPYEMVFIGDSWGSNYSGQLPTLLADYLRCTLHNYARSSMGFVQGDYNFLAQAQKAVADTSINPERVKYVVMLGGSNDWSHDITNGGTLASAMNAVANVVKNVFKRATIHVAFDWRWKAGNTIYHKLNEQIEVWNEACRQVAAQGYPIICHPESVTWLSKSYFNSEDMVHPTENGNKFFAQLFAIAIQGGNMSPYRTNVTMVSLNGYSGISGNLYLSFTERELTVEVYMNVTEEVSGSHVIKQDTDLLPVQLFKAPNVSSNSNTLGVSMAKTNGQGACNIAIKFYVDSNGTDQVYVVPLPGNSIATGYYFGSTTFRFFS